MAFTTRHRALCFELFGIPRLGTSTLVTSLVDTPPDLDYGFDASYSSGEHTGIVTILEAKLTAVENLSDVGTENRVKELLERYDEIASSSLFLKESGNTKGFIGDDEREIRRVRELVANNIGFTLVSSGFDNEVANKYRKSGLGDR